jgi:hypothetical protein
VIFTKIGPVSGVVEMLVDSGRFEGVSEAEDDRKK